MQRLCDSVTVYGFGVAGMGNCAKCGYSKGGGAGGAGGGQAGTSERSEKFSYHYYKGAGSRHVGDDVHSFSVEEKVGALPFVPVQTCALVFFCGSRLGL